MRRCERRATTTRAREEGERERAATATTTAAAAHERRQDFAFKLIGATGREEPLLRPDSERETARERETGGERREQIRCSGSNTHTHTRSLAHSTGTAIASINSQSATQEHPVSSSILFRSILIPCCRPLMITLFRT